MSNVSIRDVGGVLMTLQNMLAGFAQKRGRRIEFIYRCCMMQWC